ncbi:MAG: hypothetical protein M1828_003276 [Chrysothrix sp. TS-e1954]|nr:MAG: hypothetical protein M1828_003276 [Chrysothrix sp. TS-e1954]
MATPGAGFQFAPQPVSWTKRDILLFAASIGCTRTSDLHYLYELHPSFAAFPTYPIVLPFKGTATSVVDFYAKSSATPIPGVPALDPKRVVDGQRRMEFLRDLPTSSEGGEFEVRSRVLGVYDKGKPGTVVETESTLVDKRTGVVYTRAVGQGFYTGQGGWGGPKGEKGPSYEPPKGRKPDVTAEIRTGDEVALLYRLNGDYNPLHAEEGPGKKMGFGGAITHGLHSWNTTARTVLAEFGGSEARRLKEFQARFASPVRPGETLVVQMWEMGKVEGGSEIRFVARVGGEGGRVCLSNGRAVVDVKGGRSKL